MLIKILFHYQLHLFSNGMIEQGKFYLVSFYVCVQQPPSLVLMSYGRWSLNFILICLQRNCNNKLKLEYDKVKVGLYCQGDSLTLTLGINA